ncbi:TBC1 domain family member 1 [Callorhinchus milii]|uniref:TBC1 domain family member 1 n=1 Tax=Callorhinchus milii TaxID=7868 RepID=UPI0004572C6E|nr:TBC1 domain family member 1 [Callorhinchus milii]|eukprot:gi/632944053/ref/XP_007887289.1/ PREDICTED: TBC1 domain family member 1 isoform X2 [Callorhinchus milii]
MEMAPLFSWVAKVPEIISTIRQAGKIARQEEAQRPAHELDDAFSQKYEVLFCGRVTVAHKKAPPALIDECIEKFNHLRTSDDKESKESAEQKGTGGLSAGHSLLSNSKLPGCVVPTTAKGEKSNKAVTKLGGQHVPCTAQSQSLLQRWDLCDGSSNSNCSEQDSGGSLDLWRHSSASDMVQPTDMKANRTMLFTIGQSEIYLISPDTKKVAIEKSFKEISFCSQGIKHVDHFGFICRENPDTGSCHFVCYVFQCTNEALVDDIMLTLRQAFTAAAIHQNVRIQLCESCPMNCLHKLCERIEGFSPSKAKLEIQKHLSTFSNPDQASIFEDVQKMKPKNEQEENELVLSMLRQLYEEQQKLHNHNGDAKQTSQNPTQNSTLNEQQSLSLSGRFRLDHFKIRAKKSFTESLENILSRGGSKFKTHWSAESSDLEEISFNKTSLSLSSSNFFKAASPDESDVLPPPMSPLKSHGSTGDLLKALDKSDELTPLPFRRRASTFSYMPSSVEQQQHSQEETPSYPKPKLMRHHSVSTDTPQSDYESRPTPGRGRNCDGNVPRVRRHSWRQQIFLRVASPQKGCESSCRYDDYSDLDVTPKSPLAATCSDGHLGAVVEERKRTPKELQGLWRKAILQQILLLRMEKENQKLQASESDLQNKRLKLDYEEITLCLKDVTLVWEKMLSTPGRAKVKFDTEKIHVAMGQGVPRQHRGEIWKLLAEQHQLRHQLPPKQQPNDTPYKELLKQLTTQQHAILIDLGRTFPTHPYFSAQLGAGQLSLFNLLKAYSLLDQEVGYCQGLSFVAGILLLHMSEEDAFRMLKFLMYDMGLRRQYRPDMIILQIQMYQLSRLLHDYHRDLYCHFEENEISPSLYAAPWFLTMFASQFPLGFVARVFDMIFLQGSEVIFKVALSLLGSHKPLILQHENLESIVDFIKCTLPNLGLVQMEKTIIQVFDMDLSKQLQAYEVEYHVLQDEMMDSAHPMNDNQRMEKLERSNNCLRKQNSDLLEELEIAHAKIQNLEATVEGLASNETKLKQAIRTLELERGALLDTVTDFRRQLPNIAPFDDGTFFEANEKECKF